MNNYQLHVDGEPFGKIQNAKLEIEKEKGKTAHDSSPFNFSRGGANLTLSNAQMNMYTIYQMMGYKFIENIHMVDRFQNKKHRTKRINKKYAKKYGFTTIPKKELFVTGMSIIGHPSIIRAFKQLQEIR